MLAVPLPAASSGGPPWAPWSRWVSREAVPAGHHGAEEPAGSPRGEARWAGIRAAVLSTGRLWPPSLWAG